MIDKKDLIAIGKFQKTHALKGELNVILNIEEDYLQSGNALVVEMDGLFVPFFATGIRPKGNTSFLVKLEGIDSETEAKKFVNKDIYAIRSQLAPFLEMEEDELRDEDHLSGYEIIDEISGDKIGIIMSVDSSTQNLLFIVEDENGKELLIPAVDDLISEIDDENKKIIMSLPEGLADIN